MTENKLNKSYYCGGEGEERILRGQIDTVLLRKPDYLCPCKVLSFGQTFWNNEGISVVKGTT